MRPAAFIAAIVALVLQTGAALAHAALVVSDPADGAVLKTAPSRIVLTFNEPVSPLVLRLIDGSGLAVALDHHLEDTAVVVDRPGSIGPGTHALSWRVISADGHPVGGTILFSVGAPSAAGVPGAAEIIDWPLRESIWLCRLLIYLAFFVGVGGTFFNAFFMRDGRPARRVQQAALVAGLAAVVASVGLQGLDALGLPLSAIDRALVWKTALGTSWAATAVIAAAALIAALVGTLLRRGRVTSLLSGLSFIGVGAALAASGHASSASPGILTRPAVFVHVVAVAFWIGALPPLATALRAGNGAAALARFSRAIPVAIVSLIAAGVALAVIQVGSPAMLWATPYGRVLLAKLAMVALLLLLAAFNRWRLTAPAETGSAVAVRRLVVAIVVEMAMATVILGLVATWRFTPPPRALAAAAIAPASVHIHTARAMADVTFTPGRAGPVRASIYVMTGDFGPLDAKEVTLTIASPAAGIEPIKRPAAKESDGLWRVDNLTIPSAGRWDVDVAVLVSDFDLIRLRESIDIRP